MNKPMPREDTAPSWGAWTDLVFHVLSLVKTAPGDHSSLYSENYTNWSRRCLSNRLEAALAEPGRILSAVYRATPRSHVLHMFPALWDSIDGFLAAEGAPFGGMLWASPYKKRIAEYIHDCVGKELIDCFRESLLTAAKAGFEAEWRKRMAPQELAFAPLLCSGIQSLSHSVPGIGEAVWTLSLPLRHYGRLMSWPRAAPWICVGVPDSALAVDADHPLMQGCHEFLVWRELVSSAYSVPADTVVGTEGYAAFIQTERHAISLGEQIMAKGPWKDSYWRWRQTVLDVYPPQTA